MSAAGLLELIKQDGDERSPVAARRKRPRTATGPGQSRRLVWSPDDVRTLLEIRYSSASLERLAACRTAKQKSAWWVWLTGAVSKRLGRPIIIKQVKNRIDKLRVEYQQVRYAEHHRRANPQTFVRYPEYWDAMVKYFQGERSTPSNNADDDSLASASPTEISSNDETRSEPLVRSPLNKQAEIGDDGQCEAASSVREMVAALAGMLKAQARRLDALLSGRDEFIIQQNAINVQLCHILRRMISQTTAPL